MYVKLNYMTNVMLHKWHKLLIKHILFFLYFTHFESVGHHLRNTYLTYKDDYFKFFPSVSAIIFGFFTHTAKKSARL